MSVGKFLLRTVVISVAWNIRSEDTCLGVRCRGDAGPDRRGVGEE